MTPELDPIVYTLRAARIKRGLSQRAVAEMCNTAQSAISEIESGVTSPTLTTLRRMSEALGVTLSAGY